MVQPGNLLNEFMVNVWLCCQTRYPAGKHRFASAAAAVGSHFAIM